MWTEYGVVEEDVMRYRRLLMHMTIVGALCRKLDWSKTNGELQESHEEERWSFPGTRERALDKEPPRVVETDVRFSCIPT